MTAIGGVRWGAAVALLTLLWGVASAGDATAERATEAAPVTDFDTLVRPASPNHWLVGPADLSRLSPDQIAPVYALSAAGLTKAWREVVERHPRTRLVALADDPPQVEAEQRSALFGFVDHISFRALPLAADRSTFIAYSRSRVGYWDLGVNRRRLTAWVAALGDLVAPATPAN